MPANCRFCTALTEELESSIRSASLSLEMGISALRICSLFLLTFLLAAQSSQVARSASATPLISVPFVGCLMDGQVGPVAAPQGSSKLVTVTPPESELLAYYQVEGGFGVLAPRGWHCFGTYGSDGNTLYVTPERIDNTTLFSTSWRGFTGPAIEVAYRDGDTSERFEVARVIARVFPTYRSYVQRVRTERMEADDLPTGPYPKDQLTYKTNRMVEYLTPPGREGLGTHSHLLTSGQAITGVAILVGPTPDLWLLSIRLPRLLDVLKTPITQQLERDVRHRDK